MVQADQTEEVELPFEDESQPQPYEGHRAHIECVLGPLAASRALPKSDNLALEISAHTNEGTGCNEGGGWGARGDGVGAGASKMATSEVSTEL